MSNLSKTNKNSLILWIIFVTIFLDMLGIGILIPIFPLLVNHNSGFSVTPAAWNQANNYIFAGWLLTVYPLCQFLTTPLLGQLSDRFGRRRILILSIAGTGLGYALFGLGIRWHQPWLLIVSRIVDGISGGNISIAQAIIGDVSLPQARARNFGLTGVAIGLGFVFGPVLGGKLSDPQVCAWFNLATPFWLTTFVCGLNLLVISYCLPETLAKARRNRLVWSRGLTNVYAGLTAAGLKRIIPALFLYNAGFTFFTTFWGVILNQQFHFSQGQIGNFFAYLGCMIILAQGGVVRRLSGKVADYQVLTPAMVLTALCLLIYFLLPNAWGLAIYWVPPILAIATALTKAFSSAYIARITPATCLGEAMGINASANALAQALPAAFAGYIAAAHLRLPIALGFLLVLAAAWIFYSANRDVHQ